MESTIRLKTVFVLPLLLLSRLNLDVHVDGQDRIRTVLHAYTRPTAKYERQRLIS